MSDYIGAIHCVTMCLDFCRNTLVHTMFAKSIESIDIYDYKKNYETFPWRSSMKWVFLWNGTDWTVQWKVCRALSMVFFLLLDHNWLDEIVFSFVFSHQFYNIKLKMFWGPFFRREKENDVSWIHCCSIGKKTTQIVRPFTPEWKYG